MPQIIQRLIGITESIDYDGATVIPFGEYIKILSPGLFNITENQTFGHLVITAIGNRVLGILEE